MSENDKPEAGFLEIISRPHNIEPYHQFLGKLDKYGKEKIANINIKSTMAESMAKELGYDPDVANGITRIIEMSSPAYEKIGEEFLKEKMRI